MRIKNTFLTGVGLITVLVIGALAARDNAPPQDVSLQGKKKQQKGGTEKEEAAIRKASADFAHAFEKGDAKAVASFWTEKGEYHDDSGEIIRGRADIEKAFDEFFKEKPNMRIEVHIESIRFPSPDCAIEEGLLRQTSAGKELPSTTLYSVLHVREAGQWKIAVSREWGSGQDRLEDLEWLIGTWHANAKDRDMRLTFARDEKKPFLVGQFETKANGKVVSSGSIKIGLDRQRGQLRSWHFEDDGGHGQAVWIRDGDRWVLDAVGVLENGAETGGLNILARINHNEFTWRSIDRVVGNRRQPDTLPVKLTRVAVK
jgi:uncharacterized protein (TIGR02246 family)